jgi:hypothetical protein
MCENTGIKKKIATIMPPFNNCMFIINVVLDREVEIHLCRFAQDEHEMAP